MHDLSFFLSEKYFGNNAFQNMFIYQPALDTLELKKKQGHVLFVRNQRECILLNLNHYILLSCIASNVQNISGNKILNIF